MQIGLPQQPAAGHEPWLCNSGDTLLSKEVTASVKQPIKPSAVKHQPILQLQSGQLAYMTSG